MKADLEKRGVRVKALEWKDDRECEHCHGEGMLWEDESDGQYFDGEWIRKLGEAP